MLTCEVVLADLPLFVGGDLHQDGEQGAAAQALRSHLAECSGCQAELESLQIAREAFLSLGMDSGAPGLWPDVRAVLAAEGRFQAAPTTATPAAPVFHFRQLAAAAILAGIGLFFWSSDDETPIVPAEPEPSGLAVEETLAPETPSPVSPLRPLLPSELALSEDAAVFGESAEAPVSASPAGSSGVSVAGHNSIR